MKSILYFILLVSVSIISSKAYSQTCTANLKRGTGEYYLSFTRYNGMGRSYACQDAMYSCHLDLRIRQSYGELPYGYCEVERWGQDRFTCTYELLDQDDYLIDRFFARGYNRQNACQTARHRCYRDLTDYQNRGDYPYARCREVIGRRPYPRTEPKWPKEPREVKSITRLCKVYRMTTENDTLQVYEGRATGRQGENIEKVACDKAVSLCKKDIWGLQSCRVKSKL